MATKVRRRRDPRPMDPQCGKLVDPEKAFKLPWEGTAYYFCCEECRTRFEERQRGGAGFK